MEGLSPVPLPAEMAALLCTAKAFISILPKRQYQIRYGILSGYTWHLRFGFKN
jgi:hypothetical protein